MLKTLAVLALAISIIIGWTIYMQVTGGVTVSEAVYRINEIHPVFPFLFGLCAGHFWFPRAKK